LSDLTLADLHARARDLGVSGYRKLTRPELEAAIEAGRGGGKPKSGERSASSRQQGGRRGGRGGRGRGRGGGGGRGGSGERSRGQRREGGAERERSREPEEEVETKEVTGILDRMPQGYGFLRLSGLNAAEGDVYVSASQIKRCELRPGDEVAGPAREPRRGEQHRALVRVASVNGQEPEGERSEFEDLKPVPPSRRLLADDAEAPVLLRAHDLLAPLAFGQRVLVLAEPRSGRTSLLREIGEAVTGTDAKLVILLADEKPEEVTAWERALPDAEIVAAPADQEPREQVRAAELGIGQAKRRAEAGEDIVFLIDSLSRLALGYRDPARVKRIFGAGRDLGEDGGSLTVIATVLTDDDTGEAVKKALETTENAMVRLSAELAAAGVTPPLVAAETRVSGEEELRSPEELEKVRALRSELAEMNPADAARALGERLEGSKSNAELLKS
jgi:transcription termination factor Rho